VTLQVYVARKPNIHYKFNAGGWKSDSRVYETESPSDKHKRELFSVTPDRSCKSALRLSGWWWGACFLVLPTESLSLPLYKCLRVIYRRVDETDCRASVG
jgi:hypothetical protein